MPGYTVAVPTSGALEGTETITKDWFGAIQTGFHNFNGFDEAAAALDLGLMRWPGGTLSEVREDVYGLERDGLFDATDLWRNDPGRDRPDLTDSLQYSIENDLHFSMIVPTARYKGDLAQGEAHLSDFLDDLFTGRYGPLPEKFTLELGNEYFALPEFADDPGAYGEIASRFAEVISDSMDLYLTDAERSGINVAVQMGHGPEHNAAILEQFSPDALAVTNSAVFHSLPISLRNLNKDQFGDANRYESAEQNFEEWKTAIAASGGSDDPDLFMSAWTVGSSTNDANTLDLEWHDFGARSASVVLETVSGYSSIGVDSAAIWGVDVFNLNSVTQMQDGELYLTHTGEMYRMMSEALPGSTYLGEFTPHTRDEAVMTHTYGDGDRLTNYVAINEHAGENDLVTLSFGDATNFKVISAEMLSSRLADDYTGGADDPEARLYEVPVTYDVNTLFTRDGIVLDFNQDYEVAEVIVELGEGVDGSNRDDWIMGTWRTDRMEGLAGDDYLNAGSGYDLLVGGKGDDILMGGNGRDRLYGNLDNDRLHGGDGDDLLNGGAGFDRLWGGAGDDTFQFSEDADGGEIRDFELGADQIDLIDVLRGAGSLRVTGPNATETVDRGAAGFGPEYRMELSQDGQDTLMAVQDAEGAQVMSVRVTGVSADELSNSLSSFTFFEKGGAGLAGPSNVPVSGSHAVPVADSSAAMVAGGNPAAAQPVDGPTTAAEGEPSEAFWKTFKAAPSGAQAPASGDVLFETSDLGLANAPEANAQDPMAPLFGAFEDPFAVSDEDTEDVTLDYLMVA